MRRIAILGALALTLSVAAPVFAASHTTPSSSHPATAGARTLRATATSGKTSLSSRVVIAAGGKSATFWVSIKGEAPKSRDTNVLDIGACGAKGDTALISVSRMTSAAGTWGGTVRLTAAEVAKLDAALKAGKHFSVTSTDGSVRLCGSYSG